MTVFRVDNPHTKPIAFWRWLIAEIRRDHPEVIFLAEAFTRRAVMRELAKDGFSQSYTYFTWKNARWELVEYLSELAHTEEAQYFRPNFFVNTPGHPHRLPRRRRAARLPDPAHPRRHAEPVLRRLLRLRALRARAAARAARSTSTTRSTSCKARRLDGPLLPHDPAPQPGPPREPGAAAPGEPALPGRPRTRRSSPTPSATGPTSSSCVVNVDPHHAQEGLVHVP